MDSRPSEPSRGRCKNKRGWTPVEDAILVEIMLDLVVSGKIKCDNGFKPGAYLQIEKLLEEKLSGCGLQATPHIESRVKTLKSKYNNIQEMLGGSGFGWDAARKMSICEREAYDLWVKAITSGAVILLSALIVFGLLQGHKDAKGLWQKPFPHLDELGIIFGKDRANGKRAFAPADLNEEVDQEEDASTDIGLNEIDVDVSATATSSGGSSTQSDKKRKSSDTYSVGFSRMVQAITKTAQSMEKLVACLAEPSLRPPSPPVDKITKVFEEVLKIPNLNESDMLDVSEIIMKDPAKVNLLFSIPENLKKTWVDKILNS
ncbi:hypothetical protein L1049_002608 [Liquidambar formosana]|uniref:Myb/SANT-like domain-containing protein n=1 Tax=Liquidambar formosana TaxID=63359 RepID=A0AAP0NFB4_LIQFO